MPIQIAPSLAADSIHAPWWDEDEVVYLHPVKSYIVDARARTRASRIPDGMQWEDVQLLSQSDRSKLELFDAGDYQLSLFENMILRWTLRFPNKPDGSPGGLIPCTLEYMAVLPDADGTFIADEIASRSGGIAAKVTAEMKSDFRDTDQPIPITGEVSASSAPAVEAEADGVGAS